MNLFKIEPQDARTIAPGCSFTLADLKTLANALALDMASDELANAGNDGTKAKLWAKLSALIAG